MPLTDTLCRNTKPSEKQTKLSDGGGLYLLVMPTGGKLWRMAYRFHKKQKTLSFGSYPAVSLKDARARRDEAKILLAKDIDPGEQKKADKRQARVQASNTFAVIAQEWFDARKAGWTTAYSERIWRRLEADIFTVIGSRPIQDIEPPELLDAIRAVEKRNAIVLAKRLLQATGQIFRFAVASGRAKRDPSQDLRGALKTAAPQKHRAALRASELPDFMQALENYEGERSTVLALHLIMHTFLRTGEVRFGKWAEIEELDGLKPLWRIPAKRMKARSEHLIPLTPQSVIILKELKTLSGKSEHILPAPTKEKVISQNTLIYALYRLGYHSRATVHGFRGTASTILNEHGFNRDWIERQLAHAERNDVRAAYNSAEWLPDRRNMLIWWSNYLDTVATNGKIITLDQSAI